MAQPCMVIPPTGLVGLSRSGGTFPPGIGRELSWEMSQAALHHPLNPPAPGHPPYRTGESSIGHDRISNVWKRLFRRGWFFKIDLKIDMHVSKFQFSQMKMRSNFLKASQKKKKSKKTDNSG